MKHRTLLIALSLAFSSLALSAADWSSVAEKVAKSAVFVESAEGSCTGSVINASAREKQNKDFILTAAHCYSATSCSRITCPRRLSTRTPKSNRDVMILEVEDTGRPALRLAAKNPERGSDVASYGYGFGMADAMFRQANVSSTSYFIPEDGIGGPFIMINAGFIGGQSGGPIVNAQGEIVMIVQRGSDSVGIGIGAEQIRESVGRYFEK
jgi:S1-C subfamily serine protease